jgi:hypothetical protein
MIVPALVLLRGLPVNIVAGTSLLVIAARSFATGPSIHCNPSGRSRENEWHQPAGGHPCKISIHFDGGILSPRAQWPALQDQLIQAMTLLHEVAQPMIDEMVREETE